METAHTCTRPIISPGLRLWPRSPWPSLAWDAKPTPRRLPPRKTLPTPWAMRPATRLATQPMPRSRTGRSQTLQPAAQSQQKCAAPATQTSWSPSSASTAPGRAQVGMCRSWPSSACTAAPACLPRLAARPLGRPSRPPARALAPTTGSAPTAGLRSRRASPAVRMPILDHGRNDIRQGNRVHRDLAGSRRPTEPLLNSPPLSG